MLGTASGVPRGQSFVLRGVLPAPSTWSVSTVPSQGLTPGPSHESAQSQPLDHQGSPPQLPSSRWVSLNPQRLFPSKVPSEVGGRPPMTHRVKDGKTLGVCEEAAFGLKTGGNTISKKKAFPDFSSCSVESQGPPMPLSNSHVLGPDAGFKTLGYFKLKVGFMMTGS